MYVPGVGSLVNLADGVKKRWQGYSPYTTFNPYVNVGSTPLGRPLLAKAYVRGDKRKHKIPNDRMTFHMAYRIAETYYNAAKYDLGSK